MATGPFGPVTEKPTGPDEKSLVQILKFKYFLYLNEISSQNSNSIFLYLNEISSQHSNSILGFLYFTFPQLLKHH